MRTLAIMEWSCDIVSASRTLSARFLLRVRARIRMSAAELVTRCAVYLLELPQVSTSTKLHFALRRSGGMTCRHVALRVHIARTVNDFPCNEALSVASAQRPTAIPLVRLITLALTSDFPVDVARLRLDFVIHGWWRMPGGAASSVAPRRPGIVA
eukprot:gene146-biopygen84